MAMHGHEVTLIVADAQGPAFSDGVQILDVGVRHGRLRRLLESTRQVFERAMATNADIYVLHDPELIPFGIRLKKMGKKVVFDSHEDVPSQVRGKPYMGKAAAWFTAHGYKIFERYACEHFDGIVGATPYIRNRFSTFHRQTIDINNFPILDEFDHARNWVDKAFQVCYVGNITAMRGIREIVAACTHLRSPAKLTLAGSFETPGLAAEIAHHPGWDRTMALGHLDRLGVREVMARSMAGLVILHPQKNYLDALPVKMFEYMAAGIPVIASDFPVWREIVEGNACGLCVDPLHPASIAAAIDYLVTQPEQAQQMGRNGRKSVVEKYNWHCEAKKMVDFYDAL
jgi:glycosyltransferase involved in cell wall biosynthesis